MKKLPIVLGILLVAVVSFFPACEVENCPPNALAYAQFAFVDQYGRSVQYTDTLTVIGQLETADTTIYDTLINKISQPTQVRSACRSATENKPGLSFSMPTASETSLQSPTAIFLTLSTWIAVP